MRLLEGESWKRLFTTFQSSAFRLETLPEYKVTSEEDEIRRFLAGEHPPSDMHYSWLDTIRKGGESGKSFQRVHVLTSPLSDYIRYEFEWAYVFNVRAGEDIRILDLSEAENPGLPERHDFWIFDDSTVVHMRYEEDGVQIDRVHLDDPDLDQYRHWKEIALANSVPFVEYYTKHR
ncbi:DUF6879 family protein [Streptosporangium subroseum]|uniref:DUF6879 family protein n=1 Tax=Streptosporangium subroseum TaxID=106412 RepID=UPI00343A99F9